MDKKTKRIDRVQNALIAVLFISFLFLLVQTPLFGGGGGKSLSSTVRGWFTSNETSDEAEDASLTTLSVPVRVVQSNGFVRIGADALTTTDAAFESSAAFLGEAIGSAYGISSVSESVFLSALEGAGLYFEFPAEVPLEVLSARLGVNAPSARAFDVRRCLLSADAGDSVVLYLQSADGSASCFSTAVRTASLTEYLETLDGKSVDFAFMLGEDYAALSPYTIVLNEVSTRYELSAASALSDYSTEELLRSADFNPHTKDRYQESSGTIVVLEAQRTLYLHTDGTLEYTGGSAGDDSLYTVPSLEDGAPTRAEICSAARGLAAALARGRTGDAALFLSGMEGDADEGYTVFFDYMVNGTPVRFSDGSHAAEITVNGRSITAFRLRLRRYTLTERESLLLPLTLSRAIAQNNMPGCELSIAYIDAYGDSVSASWIAD